MKLLEYQAKELFERFGIPTMTGAVLDSTQDVAQKIEGAGLEYPVVLKAQVQIGGRGKAGGIQFAQSGIEAQQIAQKMLHSELRGLRVEKILAVEKVQLQKEWYLSIILDRLTKFPLIIFSAEGGMEIEETAKNTPEKIAKATINPFFGVKGHTIHYLIAKSGIEKEYFDKLKSIVEKLYQMFMQYSCMLVEINPLAVDENGTVIALDGKVDIDDSALYRLPDIMAYRDELQEEPLVLDARKYGFLYISIEAGGEIAVMSNGSGMLMSCIDLITEKGMSVKAALDLGGGATAERIKEAVRITLTDADTLFISIFGGITRCDEVAQGVKMALADLSGCKKVVMRIEGTNKEKGLEIIESMKNSVKAVDGIGQGVEVLADWRCAR